MAAINNLFYSQLPVNHGLLGDLLLDAARFSEVPDDWHIVITDIRDSTRAVLNGQHENVNLVATGSIVSVLNIVFANNIAIPFFFGGDGATFILPPDLLAKVMQALAQYRETSLANFGFELRTGTIPVSDIYAKGHHIHIAKYCSSKTFSVPIVIGNGLNYAEQIIKGEDYLMAESTTGPAELDLTGMQCRWDRIPPPDDKDEVVTLLVVTRNGEQQSEAFSKVMNHLDEIYGPPHKRQPISIAKLRFKTTFNRLGVEMRMRLGKIKWLELLRNWLTNLYGYIYFRTRNGRIYLRNLVEMSDTLVIDGKINTVISGSEEQRTKLQNKLDELEHAGEILYGLHVSNASVMSCYVRDLKDDHIHFVDGSEGGYTKAATVLKGKIKLLEPGFRH